MDLSFSSVMQNSHIWIWSTPSLESKFPFFCFFFPFLSLKEWSKQLEKVYYLFLLSRVIDGLETLDDLEKLPVNEKSYRPLTDVRIKSVTIHANPIADKIG